MITRTLPYQTLFFTFLVACTPHFTMADSSNIDKIYHPYVQPLEREFEFRTILENGASRSPGDRRGAKMGYGQSFNDRWFGEIYLIGENNDERDFQIRGVEAEAQWQLTEQGEYFADWGLLFELEKTRNDDSTELSTALLTEKEWGRWSGTANVYGIYEFGDDVNDEFETALTLQGRYRYTQHLEPAIEMYKGQNTFGIGPVFLGSHSLGEARRLRWEAGVVLGLDNDTPDSTTRILLEYEF